MSEHIIATTWDEYCDEPSAQASCSCGWHTASGLTYPQALSQAEFHVDHVVGRESMPIPNAFPVSARWEETEQLHPIRAYTCLVCGGRNAMVGISRPNEDVCDCPRIDWVGE